MTVTTARSIPAPRTPTSPQTPIQRRYERPDGAAALNRTHPACESAACDHACRWDVDPWGVAVQRVHRYCTASGVEVMQIEYPPGGEPLEVPTVFLPDVQEGLTLDDARQLGMDAITVSDDLPASTSCPDDRPWCSVDPHEFTDLADGHPERLEHSGTVGVVQQDDTYGAAQHNGRGIRGASNPDELLAVSVWAYGDLPALVEVTIPRCRSGLTFSDWLSPDEARQMAALLMLGARRAEDHR